MKLALTILFSLIMQFLNAQENTVRVSFIQLISNPEKFDGKLVRVSGFMHIKPEDVGLYLSKENADYLLYECVWVNFDSSFLTNNNIKSFDNKYVELVGMFDKNEKGHTSAYQGSLNSVFQVRRLKKWY